MTENLLLDVALLVIAIYLFAWLAKWTHWHVEGKGYDEEWLKANGYWPEDK